MRTHHIKIDTEAQPGAVDLPDDLRTAQEWCDLLGARVMDPDGWRDGTRSWDEPISRDEFDRRLNVCTIDSRGYPTFYGQTA